MFCLTYLGSLLELKIKHSEFEQCLDMSSIYLKNYPWWCSLVWIKVFCAPSATYCSENSFRAKHSGTWRRRIAPQCLTTSRRTTTTRTSSGWSVRTTPSSLSLTESTLAFNKVRMSETLLTAQWLVVLRYLLQWLTLTEEKEKPYVKERNKAMFFFYIYISVSLFF